MKDDVAPDGTDGGSGVGLSFATTEPRGNRVQISIPTANPSPSESQ